MAAFNKAAELQNLLNADVVDMGRLKQLCFRGCTDSPGIRSICWRLLLNYLPEVRSDWKRTMASSRAMYESYVQQFILNTPDNEKPQACEDHPLSVSPQSKWAGFFKDNELLLQINRDCRRLYPELNFFQQSIDCSSPKPQSQSQQPAGLAEDNDASDNAASGVKDPLRGDAAARNRSGSDTVNSNLRNSQLTPYEALRRRVVYSTLQESAVQNTRGGAVVLVQKASKRNDMEPLPDGETHWEIVQRILYVFAKLNPGVAYVQGMNELVGPLYYVFVTDGLFSADTIACDAPSTPGETGRSESFWRACEADAFFCFNFLMAEVRDFFIKTLDNSKCGIGEEMRRLLGVLRRIDEPLYTRLVEEQNVKPEFFAFRWLTLLLSQEFHLPDVIRLWDALFADERRFKFLHYFCVGMLVLVRDTLMNGDFNENMHLLQNYQSSHITLEEILIKAESLYMAYELNSISTQPAAEEPRVSFDHSVTQANMLASDSLSQDEAFDENSTSSSDARNRIAFSKSSLTGMFRKNKK